MSKDRLEQSLITQGLHLQAAQLEIAELRGTLNQVLAGLEHIGSLKAADHQTLNEIDQRVTRMESEQGDIKALVQEIRQTLNEMNS